MLIDEVIKFQKLNYKDFFFIGSKWDGSGRSPYEYAFCESIRLLEKLAQIENIVMENCANDNSDNEVIESLVNVILDNGIDIDINSELRRRKNKPVSNKLTIEEVEKYWESKRPIRYGKQLHGTIAKCINRQVPKKPTLIEDKMWCCTTCNNNLLSKWSEYPKTMERPMNGQNYCMSCGQNIDWSDVNAMIKDGDAENENRNHCQGS